MQRSKRPLGRLSRTPKRSQESAWDRSDAQSAQFPTLPVAIAESLAAGWYIAISQFPVYAGALSGMIYGAILLPRAGGTRPTGPATLKHWAGIAAAVIVCGGIVVHPLLPKTTEQSLEVLCVRLVPGAEDLTADTKPGGLTPDELKLLKSLGLTGTIRFGMGQIRGNTPTEARAVIVFTGELHSRAELREPGKTHVLYVQQGDAWTMYPPNARTVRNKIAFWPSSEDVTKIAVQSDPVMGSPFVFSWYPPLTNSK